MLANNVPVHSWYVTSLQKSLIAIDKILQVDRALLGDVLVQKSLTLSFLYASHIPVLHTDRLPDPSQQAIFYTERDRFWQVLDLLRDKKMIFTHDTASKKLPEKKYKSQIFEVQYIQ